MKSFLIICLLLITGAPAFTQLPEFKNEIIFYNKYRSGKIDSLKVNEANNKKLTGRINELFRSFVTSPRVERYDSFKVDWNNANNRFLNLENYAEVSIHTFNTDNKVYDVYGYTSFIAKNYFIKDRESNSIVFEGPGGLYLVDSIYVVDKGHLLIIEKDGDINTSRIALVLRKGKRWLPINGFFGKTLHDNKPKQRKYLQLYCSFETTLSAPRDINRIFFNEASKTISYKIYDNDNRFQLIKAEWINNRFAIDDADAGENIDTYPVAVPEG